MAELLFRARASNHAGNGSWREHTLVTVQEDGHPWSPAESLPPRDGGEFYRILIPGVSVDQFNEMEEPEVDAFYQVTKRRRCRFGHEDVPRPVSNSLNNNGVRTMTLADFQSYKRDVV